MPLPFSAAFKAALAAKRTPCVLCKIVFLDGETVVGLGSHGAGPVTWGGVTYDPNDYVSVDPGNFSTGNEITSFVFKGFIGSLVTLDDVRFRMPGGRITFICVFPIPDPANPGQYIGDPTPGQWLYEDGYI